MFDKLVLFSIGKIIRHPLTLDIAKAELKRLSIVKICIQVDLLKKLPKRIWIEMGGKLPGFWQDIEYDRIPS